MREDGKTAARVNGFDGLFRRGVTPEGSKVDGPVEKEAQNVPVCGGDLHARNQKHVRALRQRRAQVVVGDGDGSEAARLGGFDQGLHAASSVDRGAGMDVQIGKQFHLCPPR